MKVFLLTVSLGGILAFILFGILADWDVSYMSVHGWIALGLCTLFTLALGGGLMALMFTPPTRATTIASRSIYRPMSEPL